MSDIHNAKFLALILPVISFIIFTAALPFRLLLMLLLLLLLNERVSKQVPAPADLDGRNQKFNSVFSNARFTLEKHTKPILKSIIVFFRIFRIMLL